MCVGLLAIFRKKLYKRVHGEEDLLHGERSASLLHSIVHHGCIKIKKD